MDARATLGVRACRDRQGQEWSSLLVVATDGRTEDVRRCDRDRLGWRSRPGKPGLDHGKGLPEQAAGSTMIPMARLSLLCHLPRVGRDLRA